MCKTIKGIQKSAARICRVVKAIGASYGFSIKLDPVTKMEIIDKVAIGGAAQVAGLNNGDRVWSVNGTRVVGMTHAEGRIQK